MCRHARTSSLYSAHRPVRWSADCCCTTTCPLHLDHWPRQNTVYTGRPTTSTGSCSRTRRRRRRFFFRQRQVVISSKVRDIDSPCRHGSLVLRVCSGAEAEHVQVTWSDVAASALRIAALTLAAHSDWFELRTTVDFLARVDLTQTLTAADDRLLVGVAGYAGAWVRWASDWAPHAASSPLTAADMNGRTLGQSREVGATHVSSLSIVW